METSDIRDPGRPGVTVRMAGREVVARRGETVLAALLRGGLHVAYSCQVGACGTCVLVATQGTPPASAQAALDAKAAAAGRFLACVAAPCEDLSVSRIEDL